MRYILVCLLFVLSISAEEGKVFFRSTPSGADVYLGPNTKPSGKTPCLLPVAFGVGKARLSLTDHTTKEVNFEVKSTSILKLDVVKLGKDLFPVDIVFLEEGWQVWVDKKPYRDSGRYVTAPVTLQLGRGQHEIRLVKKGFRDIVEQVDAEKTKSLTIDDKPSPGISSMRKETKTKIKQKKKQQKRTWDQIVGPSLVVDGKKMLDTKIDLNLSLPPLYIYPNPKDKWSDTGYTDPVSSTGRVRRAPNGIPYMSLCYRIGNGKIKQVKGPITGNGRLFLLANDDVPHDNTGTMRVKLSKDSQF